MSQNTSRDRLQRFLAWSLATLLGLGCILLYRHVVGFEFVMLDDDVNIIFNPHLGAPTLDRLYWMWTDHEQMRRYIPLGWLGFSVVYGLSGLNPAGYHGALVALHAVNAVLLFAWLLRLQDLVGGSWGNRIWPVFFAWLAAAAWAVNPLGVESIAWASGLLYAQAVCFCLLSLLVYTGLHNEAAGGWRREVRGLAALLLYAGSLLTYPIALGVMPALIGLEYWLTKRCDAGPGVAGLAGAWRFFRARIGFFAVPAAVLAITVFSRYQATARWGEVPGLLSISLPARLAQASYVLTYYLWKPWLPFNLSPIYTTFVAIDPQAGRFLVSSGLVLLAILACIWWPRFRARIGAGLAAYAVMMVPFFGITEYPHMPYDRYAILPGLLMAMAGALLLPRIGVAWLRGLAAAAALVVVAGWARLGYDQTWVWKDSLSLYQHVSSKLSDYEFPLFKFRRSAFLLFTFGRQAEAETLIARGQALFPGNEFIDQTARDFFAFRDYHLARSAAAGGGVIPLAIQHVDAGLRRVRQGEWREAEEHFHRAMALAPNYPVAAYNRALCLLKLNRLTEALHCYLWAEAHGGSGLPAASRQVFLEQLAAGAETLGESRLAGLAARRARL